MYDEAPQAVNDFLTYIETIKGKSRNTAKEYFYDLRLFLRFVKLNRKLVDKAVKFDEIVISDIGIDMIESITLSDLYDYMSYLSRERDCKTSARARKVASIKSFFKYLTDKAGLLTHNPASELESPKILKRLPKYLNIDESKKLLSSVEGEHRERDYAIITLFLNCGMRLSELVNININKIKNDTLTVIGKGDKERTIYLNSACKRALDAYLRVRPVEGVKDKNALFFK